MPTLIQSINAWPGDAFNATLKAEIENLPLNLLPLDKATTRGGYVGEDKISCTILNTREQADFIHIKTAIFFTEILICCGCGDDPVPENAYCELGVTLNRQTGNAQFEILEQE